MGEDVRRQAAGFPAAPGVYIMRDHSGTIIYVGKAKSLRNRIASYFSGKRDIKTRVLVGKIESIECIVTRTEYEALILENNLIKQWTPRYNINLKDGKTYPLIRITNEDFPRIFKTRRMIEDGSTYFGPYPDVGVLERYLEVIEKTFPLRKCRGVLRKREAPCLYYHLRRCTAPCSGKIDREGYGRDVEAVKALLSGNGEEFRASLQAEMERVAAELNFERAAGIRDAIRMLSQAFSDQKVQDFNPDSRDYIACTTEENLCTFTVLQMRKGKLLGKETYRTEIHDTEADSLQQFLLQYYQDHDPPGTVFLPHMGNFDLIAEYYRTEKGVGVSFVFPETDRDNAILRLAEENGRDDMRKRLENRRNLSVLRELQELLSLPSLPDRIEGFDISQLSGKYQAASMVSFKGGLPDKANYRIFSIKSLGDRIDDFEAIREAVARRYSRLVNEGRPLPDLVLIDGGIGQVNAAREILDALGIVGLPVIGLAKREEEIFLPGEAEPIVIPEGSPPLRVLQGVRDEAHRFATSYNKRRRVEDGKFSLLDGIPGIGEKRSRKLLREFGSLEKLREATPEEIRERAGIPASIVETLLRWLSAWDGSEDELLD